MIRRSPLAAAMIAGLLGHSVSIARPSRIARFFFSSFPNLQSPARSARARVSAASPVDGHALRTLKLPASCRGRPSGVIARPRVLPTALAPHHGPWITPACATASSDVSPSNDSRQTTAVKRQPVKRQPSNDSPSNDIPANDDASSNSFDTQSTQVRGDRPSRHAPTRSARIAQFFFSSPPQPLIRPGALALASAL